MKQKLKNIIKHITFPRVLIAYMLIAALVLAIHGEWPYSLLHINLALVWWLVDMLQEKEAVMNDTIHTLLRALRIRNRLISALYNSGIAEVKDADGTWRIEEGVVTFTANKEEDEQ